MIFDSTDFKILEEFYNIKRNEKKTTWDITKRIFPECKNDFEKTSKHNLIKLRIKGKLKDLFFFKKNGSGKWEYILIKDNVKFCKHKFPCGYKNCIMLFSEDKWNIFQV